MANAPSVPSVYPPALSNDLQRHMLAALPSNVQDEFKNLSPYVKVTNIQSIISFLTFHVIISVLHVLHAGDEGEVPPSDQADLHQSRKSLSGHLIFMIMKVVKLFK